MHGSYTNFFIQQSYGKVAEKRQLKLLHGLVLRALEADETVRINNVTITNVRLPFESNYMVYYHGDGYGEIYPHTLGYYEIYEQVKHHRLEVE